MNKNIDVQKLKNGETIKIKPKGNSMLPLIKSGQICTISPIKESKDLKINDIVYCKVKSNLYLHKISGIKKNQFQISNNKGFVNGWITANNIFGILIEVK
tara:strand:- start:10451 stop:10750 length:300 start_codon:yes stop_codon:yes gene_type:complete